MPGCDIRSGFALFSEVSGLADNRDSHAGSSRGLAVSRRETFATAKAAGGDPHFRPPRSVIHRQSALIAQANQGYGNAAPDLRTVAVAAESEQVVAGGSSGSDSGDCR